MQTPTLEETDEHMSVFREFFRNERKSLLTQMAAVRTLVAIPTASFKIPAGGWQDLMAPGSCSQICSFSLLTLGDQLGVLQRQPSGN